MTVEKENERLRDYIKEDLSKGDDMRKVKPFYRQKTFWSMVILVATVAFL